MLDYLDGVSERPVDDPVANGLRLHHAFEVALDPDADHDDYYALAAGREDGGYLLALIETCRAPLRALPSYQAARAPLLHQARLCGQSQALNHALRFEPVEDQLAEWAAQTATEAGLEAHLEWWELLAAAAASSYTVGALLALAATPGASEADACRVESAYFPWASGLNALLDSLVDLDEDPEDASHLRRYDSHEAAAERLEMIASCARERVSQLPDGAPARGDPRRDGGALPGPARGLATRPRADLARRLRRPRPLRPPVAAGPPAAPRRSRQPAPSLPARRRSRAPLVKYILLSSDDRLQRRRGAPPP